MMSTTISGKAEIAMIGLGRMGGKMARRLERGGVKVAAYDLSFDVAEKLSKEGAIIPCKTVAALIQELQSPRIVWLMLPAGGPTRQMIETLQPLLSAGDVIINGANAWYQDTIKEAELLSAKKINYVDAGVSGGIWGFANGYALMIGGESAVIALATPIFKALAPAPDKGWLHCGPVGSGHFVKMIHNGIEYGMMQAFADGFALMKGKEEFSLDIAKISEMWRHGSVVRSWLLDLTAEFLQSDQKLDNIEPFVADSGEGRWTAYEAIEQGIPAPVMSLALMMRFATQGKNDYPAKLLAMMRKGFGGHAVKAGS